MPRPVRDGRRKRRGRSRDPAGRGDRGRRRRPWRGGRARVLGPAHRGAHGDPGDHPLRRLGIQVPNSRRVRLRPGRLRPRPRPAGPRRPLRAVRDGRGRRGAARRGARPGRRGPLADRGVAGHRGRRHDPAGTGLRPGQRGR
ncbi:hypothetical protein SBRY_140062 [Actinacidiphila bryophytorum]|uniref:Uncharacterized protein n=1 Tax=Actinacidiphila bryophytorum TaxID=1436133 RepID=A0A9W4E3H0_9ACTN|nr:hypothetical protein SBRY_140062 [Actinacidiphila bryophytorum]